jgi:hypothetical protein
LLSLPIVSTYTETLDLAAYAFLHRQLFLEGVFLCLSVGGSEVLTSTSSGEPPAPPTVMLSGNTFYYLKTSRQFLLSLSLSLSQHFKMSFVGSHLMAALQGE